MTFSYGAAVLLTMSRVAAWSVVLFVVLPRLLFGRRNGGCLVADAVRMAVASIVIVHLLVVLHLFDVFSFGFALAVLGLGHASVVRHTPARVPLVRTWRRLVIGALDLLDQWDQRAEVARKLKAKLRVSVRSVQGWARRAPMTPWTLLFLGVGAGTAWLRLGDVVRHAASDLPDYGVHLSWMKEVADGRLYVDGAYPQGAEALLQVVRRFVSVDEALLLRVAPGMLECLIAGLLYWAVRRLGGRRGPALVGAALYGVFVLAGWFPVLAPPNGDVVGMTMALVLVPPAVVFAVEAMAGGGRPALVLAAQAVACLFLIQPFVGVVVVAGLTRSCFVFLGHGARALRRAAVVAVVATVAGLTAVVPLAIAFFVGGSPARSGLAPDQLFLGVGLRAASLGAPLPVGDPILMGVAVAAGFVVVLVRIGPWTLQSRSSDPGRLAVAAILFTMVALILPARFSLPALLAPSEVGRVLTPLACMVLALALDDVGQVAAMLARVGTRRRPIGLAASGRWPVGGSALQFVGTAGILVGLTAAALPLPVHTGEREQPDAAVLQLARIKGQFAPRTWTVVSSGASLPRVTGNGFLSEQAAFLENYQPETWRFDPRKPELALPPPEVLIFVRTLPVAAPLPSSLDVAIARSAPYVAEDVALRPRLLDWVERYRASRQDLRTYYRSPGLVVFWIHRSQAEEKAVLRQIDEEKRRR